MPPNRIVPALPANATSRCRRWPSTTTQPNSSCPIFLEAKYNPNAGTAHSFMTLVTILGIAAESGLTVSMRLAPATTHNALGGLLGHTLRTHDKSHCARLGRFQYGEAGRQKEAVENWRRKMCSSNNNSSHSSNNSSMSHARVRCAAVAFDGIAAPYDPREPIFAKQPIFWDTSWLRRHVRLPPPSPVVKVLDAVMPPLRIAVHIRRGDLGYYLARIRGEDRPGAALARLIPTSAYVQLLDDLFLRIRQRGFERPIRVVLHVEGAKGSALVPDFDGKLTDFEAIARRRGWANTTFALGVSNPYLAIGEVCRSDILITGASGFSHAMALVCTRPLVLAIPIWLPYKCIPNVLPLERARKATYRVVNFGRQDCWLNLTSRLKLPSGEKWLTPFLVR